MKCKIQASEKWPPGHNPQANSVQRDTPRGEGGGGGGVTNSAMTLPFTPLAKLVPRPNSTCQVPPLLPFFSTHQNTLLHSPTHSTIPHLLLVIYYKSTLKTHACNHSHFTPYPMRYMLHVQYTNKCEVAHTRQSTKRNRTILYPYPV